MKHHTMIYKRPIRVLGAPALLAASLALPLVAPASVQAQSQVGTQKSLATKPFVPRRALLVLPLKTSATWQANSIFTQALLPRTQDALERALEGTGRYSVIEVNRFDAVLQRGVRDSSYTEEEMTALLEQPGVDAARALVSKMTFNRLPKLQFSQAPLIAEFILNQLTVAGTTRVEVIGRLYDPAYVEPVKSFTVIGAPQPWSGASGAARKTSTVPVSMRPLDLAAASAATAFVRIASEMLKIAPQFDAPLLASPQALTPFGGAAAVEGETTTTETTETTTESTTTESTTEGTTETPEAPADDAAPIDAPAGDVPVDDAPAIDMPAADTPATP